MTLVLLIYRVESIWGSFSSLMEIIDLGELRLTASSLLIFKVSCIYKQNIILLKLKLGSNIPTFGVQMPLIHQPSQSQDGSVDVTALSLVDKFSA